MQTFDAKLVVSGFQSTRPVRGGTQWALDAATLKVISIHPPRAGRDHHHPQRRDKYEISIHPPRAGRDFTWVTMCSVIWYFNPPAPCGAGLCNGGEIFRQSRHFNPPAPCGAGHRGRRRPCVKQDISIHPPRAGRDIKERLERLITIKISIHPPRAGRDLQILRCHSSWKNFNPPAPCGAGLTEIVVDSVKLQFQSTRPVRGGTGRPQRVTGTFPISIHPPRAGRDGQCETVRRGSHDFNPPAPCGAGLGLVMASTQRRYFNPPAPCGAGRCISAAARTLRNFNPPAPCGAGLVSSGCRRWSDDFNPPAPCGAGRQLKAMREQGWTISIHPPRAGRDPW